MPASIPALRNTRDGRSATAIAARRGRADVLDLLGRRGIPLGLDGADVRIAACARGDRAAAGEKPAEGRKLLAEFAGNGNLEGVRCLLDLGVAASATHGEGDPYWDVTPRSTALHVAAWRARHAVVKELIARGAPVNASDGKGRTALALAVKACVDSYWKDRRSPESVAALLQAGASTAGIEIPSGYEEADRLLRR